jgi:hypothetical protein
MRVLFDLHANKVHTTYSDSEYDRMQIDSVIYKKCYNKISTAEWKEIIDHLNHYKLYEMIIHQQSIQNTQIHDINNIVYCD